MHDDHQTTRVQSALTAHGMQVQITRMEAGTRTAQDAADAVGCELEQIVKSLVLVADHEQPFLALVSGPRRASLAKLQSYVGVPVSMAKAKEAERVTGFPVGGVPPVGHITQLKILMDESLLSHPTVWAAAGTPDTLFPVAPGDLAAITRAHVTDITQ
jgi:Cys-tRNA(Pro) deacylase